MSNTLKDETIVKYNESVYQFGFALHQEKLWNKNAAKAYEKVQEFEDLLQKLNKEVPVQPKPEPALHSV